MKIAVVAANWPYPEHTVRAANVVVFELVRALAAQPGISTGFLKVSHEGDPAAGSEEEAGLAALRNAGAEVLPELILPVMPRGGSALRKLLKPSPEDFYPDVASGPAIARVLEDWGADSLMVPWSEWLTAARSTIPIVKFAYYGNPDHKTGRLRSRHERKLHGWTLGYLRLEIALLQLEKVHRAIMRRYELVGDVAAKDADYYASVGHPNAFYIRNVWIDRFAEGWRERRAALEPAEPIVILGNVGKLDGTANRYGLEYLGRQILPALRRKLPRGSFRVEILGAGQLDPTIRSFLDAPDVIFRGFVPDIDEAVLASHVFLCANNATPYKVGHTRYLHAWTLGACVIAHRDAALSMPEIEHEQNSLLGGDGREIADLIVRAARDKALRTKLGAGGWATYKSLFNADVVAAEIVERIRKYMTENPR